MTDPERPRGPIASNKVLVRALDHAVLRVGERLGYWDGERADEPVKKTR